MGGPCFHEPCASALGPERPSATKRASLANRFMEISLFEKPCALFAQQQADIVRHIGRGLPVAEHQARSALAVDDIVAGAVIHRVVPLWSRHLLVEDLERTRRAARCRKVPREAEKRRLERSHVPGKKCWRIALGIDGDEHALYALAVLAQSVHRGGKRRERGRANVRAAREPESDDDDLVREIGLSAQFTVVAEEPKTSVVALAGDVDALERERRSAHKHAARRKEQ